MRRGKGRGQKDEFGELLTLSCYLLAAACLASGRLAWALPCCFQPLISARHTRHAGGGSSNDWSSILSLSCDAQSSAYRCCSSRCQCRWWQTCAGLRRDIDLEFVLDVRFVPIEDCCQYLSREQRTPVNLESPVPLRACTCSDPLFSAPWSLPSQRKRNR
jgi:hypothetical protein